MEPGDSTARRRPAALEVRNTIPLARYTFIFSSQPVCVIRAPRLPSARY